MYRLTVIYDHPADPDAFLRHYRDVHAVLASKMPRLQSYEWGVCEMPDGSAPPHFVVATLDWASKDDAMAALQSPEGQAGTADLGNFTEPDQVRLFFQELTEAV
ncbi:EthD family reductase [Saccharopolyspora sp. TS4A08]|uniref:EthD family reductase n=1 Tax=Saccharopolyspora ipomoeae TaxID=3042027 RepID=A0ABT6PX88_9PSEU|nr:EthD family reductase [Saccharopolyspora sp. TS4A08]MDI2031976.1 EthD family reductase [Saccharopolyspora sp. TS4A08]